MANFKLGKNAPLHKPKHLALTDFMDRETTWPAVPPKGWEFAVPQAEMSVLGNDLWGDCPFAGVYGLAQIQSNNANPSDPIVPTTAQALALYSIVTGFDPNAGPSGNNPTDNGGVLTDVLTYWQKTGFEVTTRSGKSRLSQIVGWAALDISSFALMRWAAYTFGGSYLGINCPQECEDNTINWNFAPGLPSAGGHCIDQAGEGGAGGKMRSWGLFIPASAAFMGGYIDEGYIVIDKDWLNAQNVAPSGLDLNALTAAMATL